jgi:hypothetical protein
MNPKKTEKLRNLLNKRFSIDYYYTEKEVNPDFRIKYIVYFTISRKVNLNCFIRVSDLSLINSDFTNVIKWDRLSRNILHEVIMNGFSIYMAFDNILRSIISSTFLLNTTIEI